MVFHNGETTVFYLPKTLNMEPVKWHPGIGDSFLETIIFRFQPLNLRNVVVFHPPELLFGLLYGLSCINFSL